MVKQAPKKKSKLTADRRATSRRSGADRRKKTTETEFTGTERRTTSRRKTERRRQIDPTTCERDYSDEEVEFMQAMDD